MNGLIIGRFQPFHKGHLAAIHYGLKECESLWVGIGSSNVSHQERNPFTAEERKEMILGSLDEESKKRVRIFYVPDIEAHELWTHHVDAIVPKYEIVFSNDPYTLELFGKRGIKAVEVPYLQRDLISGTRIRELISSGEEWEEFVPQGTRTKLRQMLAEGSIKRP